MRRPSKLQFLAVVLCVFALVVAQALGGIARYFCACGETPVATPAAYCDGPHGQMCAQNEAQGCGAASDDTGERRDHQVVKQEVQARALEIAAPVVAPQVLAAILPLVEVLFARQEMKPPVVHSVDLGESPPFGVTVARTVVLRI